MRLIIQLVICILLMSCNLKNKDLKEQTKKLPNILIFIGDDMSWNDCEPYGSKVVKTPNIKKLANEGISFDNMFTSTAMCAPTRQQLMTGLYPVRSGAYPNHSEVYGGVKSFVHHFGELGYEVALIGKKHYGPQDSFPINYLGGLQHDTGYGGKDINLSKINPIVTGDKPFFLIIAQNQPHTPWNRGDSNKYKDEDLIIPDYMIDTPITRKELSSYYTEITYMDSLLGKTLDYISKANKTKNTISIFTSEQGFSFPFGKWTCYDLGLKTAFIAKWPGIIKPNTRNKAMTQYVDIIPTLLDAIGENPNEINVGISDSNGNTGFDGKSFFYSMIGKTNNHRDFSYGVQTSRGVINGPKSYPIRSIRTKKYKYIQNLSHNEIFYNILTAEDTTRTGYLIYKSWLKYAKNEEELNRVKSYKNRPFEELYDLENDPFEKTNIAEKPEYFDIKNDLAIKLKDWMKQQGDLGIETEMKAISRQNRDGKGEWFPFEQKINSKS